MWCGRNYSGAQFPGVFNRDRCLELTWHWTVPAAKYYSFVLCSCLYRYLCCSLEVAARASIAFVVLTFGDLNKPINIKAHPGMSGYITFILSLKM